MDAEQVYLSMMGELIDPLPGVENAFGPGKPCERLYKTIYEANRRLCQRLGTPEEDPDVETIVDSFFQMNRELCMRMYRLGREHAASSDQK